ncbi:hypothetical protein T06_8807 [Trichinella sp. T6]|nr:hypothetical protein T06_8807 [Trichinella sp. T6]
MHMEKKEEKWSKRRASERMVDRLVVESVVGQLRSLLNCDTLEKIRFAEVERERFFITKTQ